MSPVAPSLWRPDRRAPGVELDDERVVVRVLAGHEELVAEFDATEEVSEDREPARRLDGEVVDELPVILALIAVSAGPLPKPVGGERDEEGVVARVRDARTRSPPAHAADRRGESPRA
jgi:hypothetical protein